MYLTGYLTQVRDYKIDDGWQDNMVALKIPNLEIKQIFEAKRARSVDELESECEKACMQGILRTSMTVIIFIAMALHSIKSVAW